MGSFSCYTRASDPWQNFLGVDAVVPARDYMRRWYGALMQQLAAGGLTYKVSGAFMWNCVSWDVQGVYGCSSSKEGSYADPGVVASIRMHNAAMLAQ